MDDRQAEREQMVARQLEARDITDVNVLAAMRKVPRHCFVPERLADAAYDDCPLPIGHGATISQPYIVALVAQLAAIRPGDRVLDIGSGSGYQAAVLAAMGAEVYGVELVPALTQQAIARLRRLGIQNVQLRSGQGQAGWPEVAPFRAILVAAAAPTIPPALREQLDLGGRLILPVGGSDGQTLQLVVRTPEGCSERSITSVAFVPLRDSAIDEQVA